MTAIITLTTAGADTGPFNIFSNVDNYVTAFEINISKTSLLQGFTSINIPNGATILRLKSMGACTNFIDINMPIVPTLPTYVSFLKTANSVQNNPDSLNLCEQETTIVLYFVILNNSGNNSANNRIAYSDSSLLTPYNGQNQTWVISFNGIKSSASINVNGLVIVEQDCTLV